MSPNSDLKSHARSVSRRASRCSGIIMLSFLTFLSMPRESGGAPIYLFFSPGRLQQPFDAERNGAVAEGELRVPTADGYDLYLHTEDKRPFSDGNYIERLVGVFLPDRPSNVFGLAVSIHVEISKLETGRELPILNGNFSRERLIKGSDRSYWNHIVGLQLKQGLYRIRVTSLRDHPELKGLDVSLDVHVPYRS